MLMEQHGPGVNDQELAVETTSRARAVTRGNLLPVTLILLAAAAAVAPMLRYGPSCGDDFSFHIVSWMEALNAWRHGALYPHWAESPNFAAGEPRFLFYPPLSWILGAAMGALFGWQNASIALSFVLLAATGLATYAFARYFLPKDPATLAGCVAIFSGYALYTATRRAAYGELAGGFAIPLILLFALKSSVLSPTPAQAPGKRFIFTGSGAASILALAAAIAAAWLSDAPVGVMGCYLLAAFSLALAITHRSIVPVLRATAAVILGLGFTAFYLVPAAFEQKWVNVQMAINDPWFRVENGFLFERGSGDYLSEHDIELHRISLLFTLMLALTAVSLLVCWLRKTMPGERKVWLPLALIPLAILFLQLPISLPVWNLLPKLRFLQFPWRWLIVLEAPLGVFAAAALWPRAPRPRIAVVSLCVIVFAATALFTGKHFRRRCYDIGNTPAIPAMTSQFTTGAGSPGRSEYAPQGSSRWLIAANLPAACLVSNSMAGLGKSNPSDQHLFWSADQQSCDATYPFSAQTLVHRSVEATAPHSGYLIVRLRRFPAWDVRVNGNAVTSFPVRQDGLYAVPISAGKFTFTADWTTTPDVQIGRAITLASLFAAAILILLQRRRRQ